MRTTGDYYQEIIIPGEKMGCLCSKCDEPKIKIYDCIPSGDGFDHLRPKGTITLSIDRKYNISVVDLRFVGWYENGVRLWPKHTEQRENFLLLERTPLQTPSVSSSDDSGFDTEF